MGIELYPQSTSLVLWRRCRPYPGSNGVKWRQDRRCERDLGPAVPSRHPL